MEVQLVKLRLFEKLQIAYYVRKVDPSIYLILLSEFEIRKIVFKYLQLHKIYDYYYALEEGVEID